jgi:ATP-binding cassette subfamily A (ABC1) protein 3
MFTTISRAGLQQVNFDIFALLYVPEWVAWFLLILQVPFWFSIYLWLEEIMPSEYGTQRHPCFCLGCGKDKEQMQRRSDEEAHLVADEIYSPDDPIRLEYLTKRFGKLTAVNKLRFSIKEGEIFTILGHNGAGKTTAIYMLTGVLTASEGDAVVYGHRISTEMAEVQKSIGLCQQFDVLFDEMTCRQHLVMICRIKDMD